LFLNFAIMGTVESILFPDLAEMQKKSVKKGNKEQRRSIRTEYGEDAERPIVSKEVPLGVCHYKTGDYQAVPDQRLPDDVYSQVLDCVVKGCTDILLTHNGKVLLGERVTYPQKSWWFPAGGRINPGLAPEENCMRLCKNELGLTVEDTSRFKYVGTYSYAWRMREQSPKNRGTQDISIVFCLDVTAKEVPWDFSPSHFSDMKWVDLSLVTSTEYHPALCRAVRDLQSTKSLVQLIERTAANPDMEPEEIGETFKAWCLEKYDNKEIAANSVKLAGDAEEPGDQQTEKTTPLKEPVPSS